MTAVLPDKSPSASPRRVSAADRDRRLLVELPGQRCPANAGDLVRTAWEPGVTVVVADLSEVVQWDDACVANLHAAYRDLADRRVQLRIVVWSAGFYAALRVGPGRDLSVYANVDIALRTF